MINQQKQNDFSFIEDILNINIKLLEEIRHTNFDNIHEDARLWLLANLKPTVVTIVRLLEKYAGDKRTERVPQKMDEGASGEKKDAPA